MENLSSLQIPVESQKREREMPSTPTFFPTNREKLHRRHAILDTTYDIPLAVRQPICLVSIVPHMHGEMPVVICRDNGKVKDANVIVKTVPNNNPLSTRLMAPSGKNHMEAQSGSYDCPTYNSTLRIIYVSRIRMLSNVRCLPDLMVSETEKVNFLPRDFLDDTRTMFSEKGIRGLRADPVFAEYIHDPDYCKYYPMKNEYVEKVFISRPINGVREEQFFGFYIDFAIIRPKNETSSTVTVETFILANKSPEDSEASHRYIEKLLIGGDPEINQRLHEFIETGVCKLSTIIEAVSSYTKEMGIEDGYAELFLTDLTCSAYRTFVDSPRNRKNIEPHDLTPIQVDEMNKEIVDDLLVKYGIPLSNPGHYINKKRNALENGCGVLYLSKIQSKQLSKSQLEKREYDKIFHILNAKLPELRSRVASGFSFFNKRRHRTKRRPRTRRSKRRSKRRTNRRGTNRRGTRK